MEFVGYVTEYIHLRENNESLARENALLKAKLPGAFYENQLITTVISDSSRSQTYSYINARAINNSVNKRNNYLTLDKGSKHGIKSEMGVISSSGVVGIVKDVSEHYCTVMSLLHKNIRLSARFKNNNYFGSVTWNGADFTIAQLSEIPKHVKFNIGDTLVTTRYSSIFPDGIIIGTVHYSQDAPGGSFQNIDLKLSTEFSNLSHVYIVENVLKKEKKMLEDLTQSEDDN